MPCQKVGKHLDENENYLTTMTSYMIINMLMIMNNIRMIMINILLRINIWMTTNNIWMIMINIWLVIGSRVIDSKQGCTHFMAREAGRGRSLVSIIKMAMMVWNIANGQTDIDMVI